jgi:hypothetical protein
LAANLEHLAELIRAKNDADLAIARMLGRPALSGNIGEFVAARVFGIDLMAAGNHAGYDGMFRDPPLAGNTVNIKTYSRNEWILDIGRHPCDYYLVLSGPTGQARVRPWVIDSVYLFDSEDLLPKLRARGIKISVATSVRKEFWEPARIFPARRGAPLQLTKTQITALELFAVAGLLERG